MHCTVAVLALSPPLKASNVLCINGNNKNWRTLQIAGDGDNVERLLTARAL